MWIKRGAISEEYIIKIILIVLFLAVAFLGIKILGQQLNIGEKIKDLFSFGRN